jgi:arylsulfatase A-like enzyme
MSLPKWVHVGLPTSSARGDLFRWLVDLLVASHADLVWAMAAGWLGFLALALVRRGRARPRTSAAVWYGWVGLCVACVVYVVVSVRVFGFLRTPLTYSLLYLAHDARSMRSSVGAFVTPGFVTALAVAPLLYVALALLSDRYLRVKPRSLRVASVLLTALVLYQGYFGEKVLNLYWHWRPDHRIAENPHWALLSSLITELRGGPAPVRLDQEYPREDLADFSPGGEARLAGAKLPRRPKNVILIVLESTSTRYLGIYGSSYATTPRLQTEAAAGNCLVVDNCYAHVGMTASSLVALTASNYPGISFRQETIERPDRPGTTLPQLLRPLGYRSAFLTSADLRYASMDRYLVGRGFDDVRDFRKLGGPHTFSWGTEDRFLFDGLRAWIGQDPARPFFAVAWTAQTHHPYAATAGATPVDFFEKSPPPPREREPLNRYLNLLREADTHLGDLFDWLGAQGLSEDTLVAITGDHGEAFGDPHDTFAHGMHLYEENVHVPLVLWWPGQFKAAPNVSTPVGHVDLTPTLADLLGVAAAPSWQGRSLFDPQRPPRAYFFAADHDYLLGVREDDWKYVYNATTGFEELYDLREDRNEQTNLAPKNSERSRRLRQRLAAWLDQSRR